MSYEFNKPNGSWYYSANHDSPDFALVVPMPDGSTALIIHLAVTTSRKMVGACNALRGQLWAASHYFRSRLSHG
jgi:hypothetical protein